MSQLVVNFPFITIGLVQKPLNSTVHPILDTSFDVLKAYAISLIANQSTEYSFNVRTSSTGWVRFIPAYGFVHVAFYMWRLDSAFIILRMNCKSFSEILEVHKGLQIVLPRMLASKAGSGISLQRDRWSSFYSFFHCIFVLLCFRVFIPQICFGISNAIRSLLLF